MKTTVPKFSAISTFLVDYFFLVFFVILYQYGFYHSICSHRAGSAHNALSLWLSLVSPLVKFFGFDPGAAGLPCMSPLALAFVWVGLCPFGRATFIGWRPLEPPRWLLGVVRWHSGALLVFLFLLFDLLNDLPDLPLCSLWERHHMQDEMLIDTLQCVHMKIMDQCKGKDQHNVKIIWKKNPIKILLCKSI